MRRRPRNDGMIRQRDDGRWESRIYLGWQNGRRKSKSFYGATEQEVTDLLNDAKRRYKEGQPVTTSRETVREFVNRWMAGAEPRYRPRAFHSYRETLDRHVLPFLGDLALNELTMPRVQAWLDDKAAAGVSARTCRYARVVFRAVIGRAVAQRLIASNPAGRGIELPAYQEREMTPLDSAQAQAFLKAVDGHELEGLFTTALACGLRIGEALGLQWNDYDADKGTLTVNRTVGRLPTVGLVTGPPKSRQSRRTLKLPTVVSSALKRHRTRQLEARLAAGKAWQAGDWVFTTPIGTVLDVSNVRREFRVLLAKAKLPMIRLHDMRHSAATLLLAQGVSVRLIMSVLGHSQVTTTMRYVHAVEKLQEHAATEMDKALGVAVAGA